MKPSVQKIITKLAKEKENKVELSLVQDADGIYSSIVKGAQRQVAILQKVESELNKLEGEAKRLQKLEQKIEQQAKELGIDIDQVLPQSYAADTWVSDLNKYASKVGEIASAL